MFAGMELSMFVLAGDASIIDLLSSVTHATPEQKLVGAWFTRYVGSVMFGAACGGWIFGWLGDRYGRARAMAWAVACYSLVTAVTYFVASPSQLLLLRFLVGLGIGGVWPNAVALVAEAWPNASRPFVAGVLGTAANAGFILLGLVGMLWLVTVDSWRWLTIVGAAPLLLALFIRAVVPESPKWLATRTQHAPSEHSDVRTNVGASAGAHRTQNTAPERFNVRANVATSAEASRGQIAAPERSNVRANVGTSGDRVHPLREIFTPPLLKRTILGILLGAIPLVGNAANGNWAVFWAGQAKKAAAAPTATATPTTSTSATKPAEKSDAGKSDTARSDARKAARLKAKTQVQRSTGGLIGSLVGGWITVLLGRRLTYFVTSAVYVVTSCYLFGRLFPGHPQFGPVAFTLGLVGNIYFGWLPLYLPELFPTRVRSTGTGVTFNSGRVFAALATLGASALVTAFHGDLARVGLWTGGIYAFGLIIILFAPSTAGTKLAD
jgi:MFS family permease